MLDVRQNVYNIKIEAIQGQRKAEFLQAILSEINRLKNSPAIWAQVQARAAEIKEGK